MVTTITYNNKVAINENPNIADVNKVKDDDMNEIKSVVNNNATELSNLETSVTNLSIYSTSEVDTGKKWTDNKPLYRKTFISTNSSREETISLSGLNIEEAFFDFSHSSIKFTTPSRVVPIVVTQVGTDSSTNATTGNQSGIYFASDFSSFTIETGVGWSGASKKVITIEYTKTTD